MSLSLELHFIVKQAAGVVTYRQLSFMLRAQSVKGPIYFDTFQCNSHTDKTFISASFQTFILRYHFAENIVSHYVKSESVSICACTDGKKRLK